MRKAAVHGIGVTLLSKPDALSYLESGIPMQLIPSWYVNARPISLYFSNRSLPPAKTRAFIDFAVEVFARKDFLNDSLEASDNAHRSIFRAIHCRRTFHLDRFGVTSPRTSPTGWEAPCLIFGKQAMTARKHRT
ncbi:hypothetical protein GR212_18485 [Rhizobium lusitanum]|uniref:LysR substrate-binding domain-containing protein n=1 Tax=Rhizobium lusitanum TaxID=293958 RepID=A0A6L9UBB7_9HYPH|nr:hypothetical protein [Rhizobium lusitanum]